MPTSPPSAPSTDHRAEFGPLKARLHLQWILVMFTLVAFFGVLLFVVAGSQGPIAWGIGAAAFVALAWVVDLRIWKDYRCPGCHGKFDRLDRRPGPRKCRRCGALLGD